MRLGQSSIETLVLLSFMLFFIIPFSLFFLTVSNSDLSKNSVDQFQLSVRKIADAANEVYLQGNGAKKIAVIYYPSSVLNGSVGNNIISLTLDVDGKNSDVIAYTFANVTGDLSGKKPSGLQKIFMFYNSTSNSVYIKYLE